MIPGLLWSFWRARGAPNASGAPSPVILGRAPKRCFVFCDLETSSVATLFSVGPYRNPVSLRIQPKTKISTPTSIISFIHQLATSAYYLRCQIGLIACFRRLASKLLIICDVSYSKNGVSVMPHPPYLVFLYICLYELLVNFMNLKPFFYKNNLFHLFGVLGFWGAVCGNWADLCQ